MAFIDPTSELDRLMAEQVMGWRQSPCVGKRVWWSTGAASPRTDWYPSTNIAQAWEVVEHLQRDHDWTLDLSYGEDLNDAGVWHWSATFSHRGGGMFHISTALTAPLAICRAAIEAMHWAAAPQRLGQAAPGGLS